MADVEVKFIKKFQHECKVGDFILKIDEPVDFGGDETGPSPYDLLLAALGSCTSMTIKMYANTKQWHIEEMNVKLSHEKIYAKDCQTCETKSGRLDKINCNIEIKGNLTEQQKLRLLEIAKKCPVYKTLTNENLIEHDILLIS